MKQRVDQQSRPNRQRTVKTNGHIARKRFGQNFLQDQATIADIVASINPKQDDLIVEIGPGLGALTQPILEQVSALSVIELDRDLVSRLHDLRLSERLTIYSEDALKFDFSRCLPDQTVAQRLRIVGNLPYNISSPLLFHLLSQRGLILDMHFMLQKEVVNRLVAQPGTKSFGRLSVMFQYYCEVAPVLEVPPEAFMPAPKVDSGVVRLRPKPVSETEHVNFSDLERVVQTAFSMRRKTLRNTLKTLFSVEEIESVGIDPGARAETLNTDDFVNLTNLMAR